MGISARNIEEIVSRALERIAFVYTEPDGETSQLDHHAQVSFKGDESSGEVLLSADEAFVLELAANLLGIGVEEVSTAEGVEALCELANMVAGELIRLLGARVSPI